MSQEYSRACLRVAVAQICQHLGWNSIHTTPMELLTDVLERYLFQIGKVTHRYSEQCKFHHLLYLKEGCSHVGIGSYSSLSFFPSSWEFSTLLFYLQTLDRKCWSLLFISRFWYLLQDFYTIIKRIDN